MATFDRNLGAMGRIPWEEILCACRIVDVILETFVVDWVRILYVELYLGISVESRVRRE